MRTGLAHVLLLSHSARPGTEPAADETDRPPHECTAPGAAGKCIPVGETLRSQSLVPEGAERSRNFYVLITQVAVEFIC